MAKAGALVLFLVSIFCLRAHAATTLSLSEALDAALKNSPTFLTAKNQYDIARLEQSNAFAVFLPSLDISSSHGPTSENNLASSATVSLTENLYDNGEALKKYSIAQYQFELSRVNYQKTKAEIIRTVALAYYRNNLSIQNLNYTKKYYEELERLSKLVSNQFYQGLKTRKDFLSFKTRAQRGHLNVIEAEQVALTSRVALLAAIGRNADDPVEFDLNVKPVLPRNDLSLEIGNDDLYESKNLGLQKKISELEINLARRRIWPELNLVGAASYGSSQYLDTSTKWTDNDATQWSVLINLKFNVIDWGVRSRNIRIASATQNVAEQNRRTTLYSAEKELTAFKLDVQHSAETYRLSKELQKMEEDTFKLLERDYRAGQATYLELTTGLANLLDAQARGQEADYRQAELYLKWKYYKGTLSEETIYE